ncbi:hypothetical protein D3C80_749680 [compost metagenome]
MAGEALHQDHYHIADRQGVLHRRHVIATNGGFVGVDQRVILGQQQVTDRLRRIRLRQGGLPDVVTVFAHAALGCADQAQGSVEAQLVGEVRVGGEGIAPAHRRALAQGTARGNHGDQQNHHEHGDARIPGGYLLRTGHRTIGGTWASQAVGALEQQAQHPSTDHPRHQVARHREAVPEHAHDGLGVFLHILEHQAVEALVELPVEVHLHQAEEQRNAGGDGQPETEQAASRHGPGTENRQQQGSDEIHRKAQVEAQAIEEGFDKRHGRRIADHFAVIDQQRKAQQAEHRQNDQCAEQRKGQVRFDSRLQQARRGPLLTQGVRGSHGV